MDGTMQRRMADTTQRNNGPSEVIFRPVPGAAAYHISVDDHMVQAGEYDLDGPKLNLCPHPDSTDVHIWTI
jgi:hypothetical protein